MKRVLEECTDLASERQAHTQRHNDDVSWSELQHSSKKLLVDNNYDAALDTCRKALDQLDVTRATILETVSIAYMKKSKFSQALEVAEKMIEYTPTLAIGYLQAGDTLAAQGRHKHAIDVYGRGLAQASIDDDHYASLQKHKAASQAQLDKRVDFITRLPNDVVQIIVALLSAHITALVISMDVSTTWRQIICDCPRGWSCIMPLDKVIFPFVPMIGHHIRKMSVTEFFDPSLLLKSVIDGQFCSLESLNLQDFDLGESHLLNLLAHLSDTLTTLTLEDNTKSRLIPTLEDVLLVCPNVEKLSYTVSGSELIYSDLEEPEETTHKIKFLELRSYYIRRDSLATLLCRCPHLEELYAHECESTDVIHLAKQHCPNLKAIGFNALTSDVSWERQNDQLGLQHIRINSCNAPESQHVISILEQAQPTLKTLALQLWDARFHTLERWSGLTGIRFDRLEQLEYFFGGSMAMHTNIAGLIRNCKALQSVTLKNLTTEEQMGSVLAEALLSLPKLKTLALIEIDDVSAIELESYFETHATMGKASPLRKVLFVNCNKGNTSILQSLVFIETLEKIHIEGCYDISANSLDMFIQQLGSRNTLASILLADMPSVNDATLYHLGSVTSLKTLKLSAINNISTDDIEALVDKLANLQSIKISRCLHVGSISTRRIKQKVSHRRKNKLIK